MPTHVCANRDKCVKYGRNDGKYQLGGPFGLTVHNIPCHFCKESEENEKLTSAFRRQTALVEQQDKVAKVAHERKEQAAQAEHDRQIQLLEIKRKATTERLDRAIVLQEKKAQAAKEAHEHDLKIKTMMHEMKSKSLDIEAEERRRKDEIARIEIDYKGKIELEKLRVESLRLEIELLKMEDSQEIKTAVVDKVAEGDGTADRKEAPASLASKKSCKTKAKKVMREFRRIKL